MKKRKKYEIYDAFENRKSAIDSANDLGDFFGKPKVKKLKKPEDAGRLKYGIYIPKR